jgi:hypothetical protein
VAHAGQDRARRLDRAGRRLLAGGGCLTLIVFPLVTMGFIVVATVFAIGLASDTERVSDQVRGLFVGALVVLGVASLLLLGLWILALRGRTWAQVLTLGIGACLAFVTLPYSLLTGPGEMRPEDVWFAIGQIIVALGPVLLASGSLLRLLARREALGRR